MLPESSFSSIFLAMSLQEREIKVKINNWYYIKLKSFCTVKDTQPKKKKQATEWEKIFSNNTSDKELISKMYK